MAELEKVIKGVFEMLQRDTWKDIDKERHRFQSVLNDVLKLLKKQAPMEPKEMKIAKCHYQCAICGSYVGTKGLTVNRFNKKYCSECGQAVKWDDNI